MATVRRDIGITVCALEEGRGTKTPFFHLDIKIQEMYFTLTCLVIQPDPSIIRIEHIQKLCQRGGVTLPKEEDVIDLPGPENQFRSGLSTNDILFPMSQKKGTPRWGHI